MLSSTGPGLLSLLRETGNESKSYLTAINIQRPTTSNIFPPSTHPLCRRPSTSVCDLYPSGLHHPRPCFSAKMRAFSLLVSLLPATSQPPLARRSLCGLRATGDTGYDYGILNSRFENLELEDGVTLEERRQHLRFRVASLPSSSFALSCDRTFLLLLSNPPARLHFRLSLSAFLLFTFSSFPLAAITHSQLRWWSFLYFGLLGTVIYNTYNTYMPSIIYNTPKYLFHLFILALGVRSSGVCSSLSLAIASAPSSDTSNLAISTCPF